MNDFDTDSLTEAAIAFMAEATTVSEDEPATLTPEQQAEADLQQAKLAAFQARMFTRRDYRKTAAHIRRLVLAGVPSLQVTAVHDAYAAVFQADSDEHPVPGYPAFDQAAFTEGCTVQ